MCASICCKILLGTLFTVTPLRFICAANQGGLAMRKDSDIFRSI
ncbi:hypothetical protein B0E54_06158 [Micromonospora sp. MH99]|nr:hypothetical protein [Micromonospora sp. MH99]